MIHCRKRRQDKEIGIILLTEKFAGRNSRNILADVRLNHKLPLLIEFLRTVTVPEERRTLSLPL